MQLYDCKVRLASSIMNEVRKKDISAAEIILIRAFHGDDSVVDITESRETVREFDKERDRLLNIYANPNRNTPKQLKEKMDRYRAALGHDSVPLPTKLPPSQVTGTPRPKRTKIEAVA